jgi:hypothetical protein
VWYETPVLEVHTDLSWPHRKAALAGRSATGAGSIAPVVRPSRSRIFAAPALSPARASPHLMPCMASGFDSDKSIGEAAGIRFSRLCRGGTRRGLMVKGRHRRTSAAVYGGMERLCDVALTSARFAG